MEKNELSCPAAFAVVATLILIGVFVWKFPTHSSDWAAWMQAFGSLVAIGVAVWATLHQQRVYAVTAKRGEQREQIVIMQSLAAELANALEMFDLVLAARLDVESIVPVVEYSDYPFPVYGALAARIGHMPSPEISKRVVSAYSQANGFLLQLKLLQRVDSALQDLMFKLHAAPTAPGPGSLIEVGDILAAPDILAIGKSPYEALLDQIKLVKTQKKDLVGQIADRRDILPTMLQQLINDLIGESEKLADASA